MAHLKIDLNLWIYDFETWVIHAQQPNFSVKNSSDCGFLHLSFLVLLLLFVVRSTTVVLEYVISHGPMEFLFLTSLILDFCFQHEHCLHKNSP